MSRPEVPQSGWAVVLLTIITAGLYWYLYLYRIASAWHEKRHWMRGFAAVLMLNLLGLALMLAWGWPGDPWRWSPEWTPTSEAIFTAIIVVGGLTEAGFISQLLRAANAPSVWRWALPAVFALSGISVLWTQMAGAIIGDVALAFAFLICVLNFHFGMLARWNGTSPTAANVVVDQPAQ